MQADFEQITRLGDSRFILSHRLSEWCGCCPELELDVAFVNIALDLLGQARLYYAYAGTRDAQKRSEDELVFQRDESDWRNLILCEQPDSNFADAIIRSMLFDHYNLISQRWMAAHCADSDLSAIAQKSCIEAEYHCKFSSDWFLRLALGTDLSAQKTQNSLDNLWRFTGEIWESDESDEAAIADKIIPPAKMLRSDWLAAIEALIAKSGLTRPDDTHQISGGRKGHHSEALGYLLAEMQHLPRSYPDAKW